MEWREIYGTTSFLEGKLTIRKTRNLDWLSWLKRQNLMTLKVKKWYHIKDKIDKSILNDKVRNINLLISIVEDFLKSIQLKTKITNFLLLINR